jgi:formiminoglutamate deiminase
MNTWWCEHAWLPPGAVAHRVLVTTSGGRIAKVEPDADPPPGAVRLRGLVIPGLANAHSHAFHRALRGHVQSGSGDFWTWRDQMYGVAQRLDPDAYLALATAVYAEMALAGITCIGEFHYLHHAPGGARYSDPNAMGRALIEAAAAVGVRLTLLDACYLSGGFGAPLQGAQLRFGDGDAQSWAGRVDSLRTEDHVRVGAAIHSVRAVAADDAGFVAKVAADRGLPLHFHLSEQVAENEQCEAFYGRTPTRVLADAGALGPKSTAVHATHLSDAEIALLVSPGSGVCLCPTTERDLADGIGPAGALAGAGVRLSLGSDSQAVIDLFEEMRGAEMDERLATNRRGNFAAAALLAAATVAGHRALGWSDAGEIAPGNRADLVAVDLESARTAACGASAETVAFAATADDVTDVVVDGRQIVRDRRHVTIDVGRALASSIAAARE